MNARRLLIRRLLPMLVAALALAGIGYGVYALWQLRGETLPTEPRLSASARFQLIRESPGHLVHIQNERLPCTECHAVGDAGTRNFDTPNSDVCGKCHASVRPTMHASVLARSEVACLHCHPFGEDHTVGPLRCMRCHERDQGFVGAIEQHHEVGCEQCHRAHGEPSLSPAPCATCHKERVGVVHGDHAADSPQTCLDCHRSHDRERAADERCADCHRRGAMRVPVTATRARGHEKCVGCHRPHVFSSAQVRPCEACHKHQPALGDSIEHRDCVGCHSPHDVRNEDVRISCVACHVQGASSDHPAVPTPADGPCIGCHAAHPHEPPPECSTCHERAAFDDAFHAEGVDCRSCHEPHAFRLGANEGCERCHDRESHLTGKTKGHRQCSACHLRAAHEPGLRPVPCSTCHGSQRVSAPTGHQVCEECHESHRGEVQKTCADCHPRRVPGDHRRVDGECAACHRAHGPDGVPSPPACQTCHLIRELPGLHATREHMRCADCHTAHGSQRGDDRISCLRCHGDRVGHETQATLCTGCHGFGR